MLSPALPAEFSAALFDSGALLLVVIVLAYRVYMRRAGASRWVPPMVDIIYSVTLMPSVCLGAVLALTLRFRFERRWVLWLSVAFLHSLSMDDVSHRRKVSPRCLRRARFVGALFQCGRPIDELCASIWSREIGPDPAWRRE